MSHVVGFLPGEKYRVEWIEDRNGYEVTCLDDDGDGAFS